MRFRILYQIISIVFYMLNFGCSPTGSVIVESDDPAFERGRAYLKVGRDVEALDQFLSVTRRVTQAPKSHLEVGRLLLTLSDRKDPVAAIYHLKRFLLLEPHARESKMVRQLIVTAEREIIRKLPGEPYNNYLESLSLKEENNRLRSEIADLRARLGSPLPSSSTQALSFEADPSSQLIEPSISPSSEMPGLPVPKDYKVEPGDSLYSISKKIYGDAKKIDAIYEANRDSLRSKNSLKVGQVLRLPSNR